MTYRVMEQFFYKRRDPNVLHTLTYILRPRTTQPIDGESQLMVNLW